MQMVSDIKAFIGVKGAGYLLAAIVLYGVGTGILAPMNAIYMSEHLHLVKREIVSIFAISLLLNIVVTLSVGIVSDKMQGKKALPLAAAAVCITGLCVYMNAADYAGALLGMALATAPSGLIMGQIFAMARSHFTQRASAIVEVALLWLRTGFSVGFFAGLLLGAMLYVVTGFHGVLWGNLMGYMALFLLLLMYTEIKGAAIGSAARHGEPFSLPMLIALLMLSCADAIRGLYLPLVFNELFGKPHLMSYLWSCQAVFELLFMTLAGYWAIRYGSKQVILLGGVCALVAYIVYALAAPLALFFAVQPIYSLSVSILYGVAMGYVQRMFIHRTGFGSSLYVFISQTAALVGYLLPAMIEGMSPHIFIIPIILVFSALLIIARRLHVERRLSQNNEIEG
ncbi:MFS transporter [Paenibacillus xerothermodurans]|uniref:MFS transporter n=1 Tax=Paenibacillus xerothermodurans TaxID=1977292 RepID=A0A2W1NNN0_PAEXE|nr:MFS transporter [Paenibacillus xerothermodurans]PZE20533.1 MFS transporter [Paenibacillus xerothermodurans]